MVNFLDLNNTAIEQMENRNYQKAVQLLHASIKSLRNLIDKSSSESNNETISSNGYDITSSSSKDSAQSSENHQQQQVDVDQNIDETVPAEALMQRKRTNIDQCDDSRLRKRQRVDAVDKQKKTDDKGRHRCSADVNRTTFACDNVHALAISGLLGRPLWLEKPKQENQAKWRIYTSSVLYNLAYAFHRMGTTTTTRLPSAASHCFGETQTQQRFRQKALNLYTLALRHAFEGRSPVVVWVCCHNLQCLLAHNKSLRHQQQHQHEALEAHKTNILRSLAASGSSASQKEDQACLLVLAMLGISGSDNPESPAAAA